MGQILVSDWFVVGKNALNEISRFLSELLRSIIGYIHLIPVFPRVLLFILLFMVAFCILLSHVLAILKYCHDWKPKPGRELSFSYFCGTGFFQWKKIYKEAHMLLLDRKWTLFSFSGMAYRLGNYTHDSSILLFICSLLYIPMAVLSCAEMILRVVFGTIWFILIALVHWMILLAFLCTYLLLLPLCWFIDGMKRVKQHCPHCYNQFDLPVFKCPKCGTAHMRLVPSMCGILYARCKCGKFMHSSLLSGRSRLDATCPKCKGSLAAANAKQFPIQLIGGNSSGKTAFLAAIQHVYLQNANDTLKYSVLGVPSDAFSELESIFQNGTTTSSSVSDIATYNFIHKKQRTAKHNLMICDIPDEVIISDEYKKNPYNLGFSEGIIIIVDPLSISSVRAECVNAGEDITNNMYSQNDVETIIVNFINKYSEIIGRRTRKMVDVPVAVLINKVDVDVVMRKVGYSRIMAEYKSNPDSYQKDIAVCRDAICRKYLVDIGLQNAINNLEAVFSHVRFFPISAIGHHSEANKSFVPEGVIEPIAWIAKKRGAGIYPLLQNTLGRSITRS